MTLTSPCGVMPSLRLVKPLMSQNSTVMTRRWPSARKRRPVDQSFDDARIDIFAEGFAHPLLVAQLLDHPVERGGQLADLVREVTSMRSVELARLDRARALQQPADRTRDAAADQDAKTSPTIAASAVRIAEIIIAWRCFCTVFACRRRSTCQHVSSDGVELLIEVVSQASTRSRLRRLPPCLRSIER